MDLLTILLFNKLKNKGGGTPSDFNAKLLPIAAFGNYVYSFIESLPEMDMQNRTSLNNFFENCTNLKSVKLKNTGNITNFNNTFSNCIKLESVEGLDTSKATNVSSIFATCQSLETAPNMDLSKVTNASRLFNGCVKLKNVPVYDLSSIVTNFAMVFNTCNALTNDSLNNIMETCISAENFTGTKTLASIGISRAQATTCTSLSNYEAFIEAGWTTGY